MTFQKAAVFDYAEKLFLLSPNHSQNLPGNFPDIPYTAPRWFVFTFITPY